MRQPARGGGKVKRIPTKKKEKNRAKKAYGTSKLEAYFASEYLDKLGLTYVYEYEAKDIGRYYDFAVVPDDDTLIMEDRHGIRSVNDRTRKLNVLFCIEIDGGFYHSDPRVVDVGNLSPMQKRNKRVDEVKNKWCGEHHIPLLRIWEYDIHNNPKVVREKLLDYSVRYARKYVKLKEKYRKVSGNLEK